jgi:hypothetical protein
MAIKASILKSLICQGGSLAPWSHPVDFGGNGYNSEARALAAGTTLGALTESGFALQSETYGRAFPDRGTEVSDEDKRANAAARKRYADVHGGHIPIYQVSKVGCPSGLRPVKVPSNAKAPHLAAWHNNLVSVVEAAAPDALIECPPIAGEGLGAVTPSGATKTPRTTGPSGWRVFSGAMEAVANGLASAINALATMSEDKAISAPVHTSLVSWASTMPDVKAITSAIFDTTLIRVDCEVELIPGANELAVATFLAKKAGREVPKTYRAVKFATDGQSFEAQPFEGTPFLRPLPVKIASAKRVIRAPAPAPVDPKTWKPTAGSLAYLMGEEVFVLAVATDGKTATIDMGDGSTLDVDSGDLTMTAPAETPAPATETPNNTAPTPVDNAQV